MQLSKIYKFGYDKSGDEVYIPFEEEELQDTQLYALNNGDWIISGKQLKELRKYLGDE